MQNKQVVLSHVKQEIKLPTGTPESLNELYPYIIAYIKSLEGGGI